MQKQILKNKNQIVILGILVTFLIAIRFLEDKIFYDPFLSFFKSEFQNELLPNYNTRKLFLNLFFRYTLNSAISVAIIQVLFNNRQLTRLSVWLYIILFVVLIVLFAIELYFFKDYMLLFYTRRFLIQPLLLILFIPAFYYQKLNP